MARILCVEDDTDIADLVKYNLERNGHDCRIVHDGRAGLDAVPQYKPDLMVLDVMMPRLSGIQVCGQLRSEPTYRDLPILMLTARGEEADIIAGLEAGADDYVTKPFRPRELVARISSLLRRSSQKDSTPGKICYPGLDIDVESHVVTIDDKRLHLTLSEFRLLLHLARHPERVFTRSKLLDQIAGREAFIIDRNVDVHVRGVRKKLGRWAPSIKTVRGVGYKFTPSDVVEEAEVTEA